MRRAATVLTLAALALGACGGGGGDEPPRSVEVPAPSGENAAAERRLGTYFERVFGSESWYRDVRGFEVRGGRPVGPEEVEGATVIVHTTLFEETGGVNNEVCFGVFAADVVDAGGRVQVVDTRGNVLARCRSDR